MCIHVHGNLPMKNFKDRKCAASPVSLSTVFQTPQFSLVINTQFSNQQIFFVPLMSVEIISTRFSEKGVNSCGHGIVFLEVDKLSRYE